MCAYPTHVHIDACICHMPVDIQFYVPMHVHSVCVQVNALYIQFSVYEYLWTLECTSRHVCTPACAYVRVSSVCWGHVRLYVYVRICTCMQDGMSMCLHLYVYWSVHVFVCGHVSVVSKDT